MLVLDRWIEDSSLDLVILIGGSVGTLVVTAVLVVIGLWFSDNLFLIYG